MAASNANGELELPAGPPPPRAPPRPTDGDTLVKASATVTLKQTHVIAILAALGLGGGFLTYKAVKAEDTAISAKETVTVAAEKTEAEGDASYEALRAREAESVAERVKLAKATNDLIQRVTLLERLVLSESSVKGVAAYRAKKKPKLDPVVPRPAPPLPATPEAAAAAAESTP